MSQFAAESSMPTQYETYPFIDSSRFTGRLTDKVVVVTGASSGIGRATTHAFAAAGASVACVARRQAELDDSHAAQSYSRDQEERLSDYDNNRTHQRSAY